MLTSEIANGKTIRSISVGKLIAFINLTDGTSFSIAVGETGLNVIARTSNEELIQMKRDVGVTMDDKHAECTGCGGPVKPETNDCLDCGRNQE